MARGQFGVTSDTLARRTGRPRDADCVFVVQVFEALYAGRVPSAWLKAYPSLKGLGPWTRDLLARIEQLARWAEGTYPRIYWLGGFTYPTGFLTAVLQVSVCLQEGRPHCAISMPAAWR